MRGNRFRTIGLLFVAGAIPIFLIVASALASGPTGTSPTDPFMVPTGGQTIAAASTFWFYFDYTTEKQGQMGGPGGGPGGGGPPPGPPPGGGPGFGPPGGGAGTRTTANVTVDANGSKDLAMAIYTPAQVTDWLRDQKTTPVGRGTPYYDTSTGLVTHDLYWSGGFNTSGRYLIAISNNSAAPIAFQLTVTGDTVMLYPTPTPSPTATLDVPITVTPVPTGTLTGRILFETATGGEIYSVEGDGTQLKLLTHGIDPSWSPDGKQIVFARWDNTNPGLFIANADGSNERVIFGAPRVRWPRMSPDGKYVVFSQDKTQVEDKPLWKLGVIDLATGKLSEPQCSQRCYTPSWSPDSTTIFYDDPDGAIMATNIAKGPPWQIGPSASYWDSSANLSRPIVNWPPIQDAAVSVDGTQIVFAMQAHDRWEVNVLSAYGGSANGVTGPGDLYYLAGVVVHNVAPAWSPDGRQIVYLSDQNGKWEFFVTDPSGQATRQVLKNVTDKVAINFVYENERIMDWTR